ncbi:tumor necrosis factor receptor superfamily member 25-like [Physella acuta]|uniref:tumor necrosis factor receptor superfamily member 25-like n=1 Tax=Physella acuta TaxID=109671 RepID=UPI0027DBBC66|nr:tumor necrosis factor receptor superfamily member 25-like [Physella acuta]
MKQTVGRRESERMFWTTTAAIFSIVTSLVGLLVVFPGQSPPTTACPSGHYLLARDQKPLQCVPCPDDMYMPDTDHTNEACARCTVPDVREHQTLLRMCNSTHDAELGCHVGYFMSRSQYGDLQYQECLRCMDCPALGLTEATPCGQFSDSECCTPPGVATDVNTTHVYC